MKKVMVKTKLGFKTGGGYENSQPCDFFIFIIYVRNKIIIIILYIYFIIIINFIYIYIKKDKTN